MNVPQDSETFGEFIKSITSVGLVTFGKCLGNGYPITAILGKKKYLKYASKVL